MLGTDFHLKIVNKMSQLFVFAEITWKQGEQEQNTNIVFDQTADTGNLKPSTWGGITNSEEVVPGLQTGYEWTLLQEVSGRGSRTRNSAH